MDLDLTQESGPLTQRIAGALGKPVWVLLPALGTDWRWFTGRTDSPWYPGVMRLFRHVPDDVHSLSSNVVLSIHENSNGEHRLLKKTVQTNHEKSTQFCVPWQ